MSDPADLWINDGRRGTLRPGGDADLVVLDRDMLAGGQVVHRVEGLP